MKLMDEIIFRNKKEFDEYIKTLWKARAESERLTFSNYFDEDTWNFCGYCLVCQQETNFEMDWQGSDGKIPNFRERMVCKSCKLNNRLRFMIYFVLHRTLKNNFSKIYTYEQITPFYDILKARGINIVGSEFLNDDKTGLAIKGIRNENALSLSFENDSFDIVISNDVFEHVENIEKTLSEAYRILKSDGKLLFSIPFSYENKTITRAEKREGKIEHLLPEQRHGDPVSADGCLVFYDYGWDILDYCKKAGFKDAYMLAYYDVKYGHIGNGIQSIFVAEK